MPLHWSCGGRWQGRQSKPQSVTERCVQGPSIPTSLHSQKRQHDWASLGRPRQGGPGREGQAGPGRQGQARPHRRGWRLERTETYKQKPNPRTTNTNIILSYVKKEKSKAQMCTNRWIKQKTHTRMHTHTHTHTHMPPPRFHHDCSKRQP